MATSAHTPPPAIEPGMDSKLLEQYSQLVEQYHTLALTAMAKENGALSYLNSKTFGKKVTKDYLQYITTLFHEYCDHARIYDYGERERLLNKVIEQHLVHRENRPALFFAERIRRLNDQNRMIDGEDYETVWYKPWTWNRVISLSESGNDQTPSRRHSCYSWEPFLWTIGGMVILSAAIKCGHMFLTSLHSRTPQECITIPSPPLQPIRRTLIDIAPSYLTSTIPIQYEDCTDTSEDLGTLESVRLALLSIVTRCILRQKERCTTAIESVWSRATEHLPELSLSQKLKKWAQQNIRPPE